MITIGSSLVSSCSCQLTCSNSRELANDLSLDPIQSFRIIPQNFSAQIRRQIVALDKIANFFDEALESEGVRKIRRKDGMIGTGRA